MTVKTVVGYTPEQVARMTEAYTSAPNAETVAILATEFGKSVKSVVAKLAQLGIYRKAEKAAAEKSGVSKAEMAITLAPGDEALQNDLVKLTKASLAKLAERMATAEVAE